MRRYSGRFVLRIPPALHGELSRRALAEGRSLNALCGEILERHPGPAESGWIGTIRSAFGEFLEGIVLFGSVARGEEQAESDLDLLMVVGAGTPLRRSLYRTWDELGPEKAEGRELSPQFIKLPESPDSAGAIWLEAALDGIVLWDRAGRIGRCLGEMRRRIADGKMRRRVSNGHPYWVQES